MTAMAAGGSGVSGRTFADGCVRLVDAAGSVPGWLRRQPENAGL
jgi:hypothetical protein